MQAVNWYKKTAEQGFTSLRHLELLGTRMYFASGSFTECNRKHNLLLIRNLGINSAKITSGVSDFFTVRQERRFTKIISKIHKLLISS